MYGIQALFPQWKTTNSWWASLKFLTHFNWTWKTPAILNAQLQPIFLENSYHVKEYGCTFSRNVYFPFNAGTSYGLHGEEASKLWERWRLLKKRSIKYLQWKLPFWGWCIWKVCNGNIFVDGIQGPETHLSCCIVNCCGSVYSFYRTQNLIPRDRKSTLIIKIITLLCPWNH